MAVTNEHEDLLVRLQQQLDTGRWPEVIAVFPYANPEAPRHTDEDFDSLTGQFKELGLNGTALFLELLRSFELEKGTALSFNFSTRSREITEKDLERDPVLLFNYMRDMLIGSRHSKSSFSAFSALKEFLKSDIPVQLEWLDKVIGEGTVILSDVQSLPITTTEGLAEAVFGPQQKPMGATTEH